MTNIFRDLTALTGGAAGALDAIDGGVLADGDFAEVWAGDDVYRYKLDATASATENSPLRINPDTNAGTKSWCLIWTSTFVGATVKLTSAESISAATGTDIEWDSADEDLGDFWEGGTNPERLTIPVGVTRVRVYAELTSSDASGEMALTITKNGAGEFKEEAETTGADTCNLISYPISVSAGDYFAARIYSANARDIEVSKTWFSIEATHFA